MDCKQIRKTLLQVSVLFLITLIQLPAAATSADDADAVHAPYSALLQKYVQGNGVAYDAWDKNAADLQSLKDYLAEMAAQNPGDWEKDRALAYWLNLYNALTLNLILENYPVKSIKDLGSLLKSPWNKEIVTVAGKELTLNNIEHNIIRPRFDDPRIHFALNCAAVSCPPLASYAFLPSKLEAQLDAVCQNALAQKNWLQLKDNTILVTKIMDWYGNDFRSGGGSIRTFLAKYQPEDKESILDENNKLEFMDYDWALNRAKSSE